MPQRGSEGDLSVEQGVGPGCSWGWAGPLAAGGVGSAALPPWWPFLQLRLPAVRTVGADTATLLVTLECEWEAAVPGRQPVLSGEAAVDRCCQPVSLGAGSSTQTDNRHRTMHGRMTPSLRSSLPGGAALEAHPRPLALFFFPPGLLPAEVLRLSLALFLSLSKKKKKKSRAHKALPGHPA